METYTLSESRQQYFLQIAECVAKASSCFSRQIGGVLVTKENQIISTGYNGPPRRVTHCGLGRLERDPTLAHICADDETTRLFATTCPRKLLGYESGEGLHLCPAAHAERNALIQAARYGIATENSILCLTCCTPCKDCLIELINAGVRTVYVTSLDRYDALSDYLITESNIQILQYS